MVILSVERGKGDSHLCVGRQTRGKNAAQMMRQIELDQSVSGVLAASADRTDWQAASDSQTFRRYVDACENSFALN
jgi:hypothetical protein